MASRQLDPCVWRGAAVAPTTVEARVWATVRLPRSLFVRRRATAVGAASTTTTTDAASTTAIDATFAATDPASAAASPIAATASPSLDRAGESASAGPLLRLGELVLCVQLGESTAAVARAWPWSAATGLDDVVAFNDDLRVPADVAVTVCRPTTGAAGADGRLHAEIYKLPASSAESPATTVRVALDSAVVRAGPLIVQSATATIRRRLTGMAVCVGATLSIDLPGVGMTTCSVCVRRAPPPGPYDSQRLIMITICELFSSPSSSSVCVCGGRPGGA